MLHRAYSRQRGYTIMRKPTRRLVLPSNDEGQASVRPETEGENERDTCVGCSSGRVVCPESLVYRWSIVVGSSERVLALDCAFLDLWLSMSIVVEG